MHRRRGLRIWGFEIKQGVEFLPPNERVEIQRWVRPDEFVSYGRRALVGLRADDVKAVSLERLSLSLSSCRITFKLKKVNKSFVPEPISCFRIPIYVYEYFMNIISISHIRIMGMLHMQEERKPRNQICENPLKIRVGKKQLRTKKWAMACSKMLSSKYGFTNHIYLVYMYLEDFTLNNPQVLICHKKAKYLTYICIHRFWH